MSIVVVPKFSFSDFLESIVRHQVTHLLLSYLVPRLADTNNNTCSLVPPQVVLLCKVTFTVVLLYISDVLARILLPSDMILAM
jgi:hypothetical protein